MGKRIVLTCFGSYGDVNPYVGIALGLRERGHTPVIATSSYYRGYVERAGISFHPVRPEVDPTDRGVMRRVMDPVRGTEFIVKDLVVRSLRESFADLSLAVRGADLLVTHPITFAGPLLAQRQGLPWVSTVLAPISFLSRFDLPVFSPAPWLKRVERVPGVAGALVTLAKRVTRGWTLPVDVLRRDLGLPPGGHPIFDGQHSPHLVLALFSSLLAEPQPDWPANVRITGAVPYDAPGNERSLPPRLRDFLDSGPPPIVFTLGSSAVAAAGTFYRESLKAVAELGVRAVLLVGSQMENRPRGRLPEAVLLEEFAAHGELFPRSAVLVHQGGSGTLHQALRAGRPSLIVPFAHDQPDNAWRAERLGVARTVRSRRYRAERARDELKILLRDPSYLAGARRAAARVRSEDGVRVACDAIERIVASG